MKTKTLPFFLPFLFLTALHAALPTLPEGTKICGSPNDPSPGGLPGKCKKPSPESGADEGDGGGSPSEAPPLGPSPHAGTTPPAGAVESPNTVIALNHGGALLSTTDLKIPGGLSGIPLEFTRYYNSRDAEGMGDLMGHGRTWTHSFTWRLSGTGTERRVSFPSGRVLDFTSPTASSYLGQASTLYMPSAGNAERLHNIGDFWYVVMTGGAAHTFERVVREDSTVIYHPRESADTRGNKLTYLSNTAGRITKASDAAGNSIDITYSQITLNRKAAVNLHTTAAAPAVGWNEVIIPAGESFRWLQAVSAPDAYFEISEIQFYKSNGSGGYTLLGGTPYGTDPALNDGPNTFDKAFDNNSSTRFSFCRPNNGIAGIDLGPTGAAAVTKIRFHVMSTFSGDLGRFVGMKFQGMKEQPQSQTVLSAVSASTGQSIGFEYGEHLDVSVGQSHSILEKVIYRNAANQITDEADFTWITSQEGTSPSIRRSIEPRSDSATPDIAFDYYPGDLAVKGQPAFVLAGDPAEEKLIQISDPRMTATYTAPDGGSHTVVNASTSAYRPTSSTDAGGKTTTYTWNTGGFLTSQATPAGTTTYTRNGRGQALTTTRPDGLVETNTYDSLGRILSRTLSATGHPSRTTTYTRNTTGRVTKITYPDTSFENYTYGTLGLLTSVREKNGSFTVHTYDTAVGSATRGLRLTTTRGLPTAASSPALGETTAYTWHLPGNASGSPARLLASVTDPRGRTTAYQYDHAGRLLKTTYPDNSFRQIVRDTFGNKTSEFDGSSLEHTTYDSFRRVLTRTDAQGGVTTYDYGLNGSSCNCYGSGGPTLVTSPAGRKTRRTYDLMGRLLTETQGFLTADAALTTNTYNTLGRLTQVTDPDGYITAFTHDPMGRVLNTTQSPYGFNFTTTNAYSPFGETLTTTAPGNRVTTTAYDAMGRPVSVKDPLNLETAITYDLGGRRTAVTQAPGTASASTTTFAYNAHDRLTLTTHPDTTTVSQTYHPGGEPHITTDELGRQVAQDTILTTWTDSLGQNWTSFASVSVQDPAGLAHTSTSYGPPMSFTGGTRRSVSPMGRVSESYSDELGRTTLTRSGLVAAGSSLTADVTDTVMTYDADGFMLTSTIDPTGLNETTTYTPDGLARVKTAKDPLNRTTTYTYDKRGNRVKTRLPDNREHTALYDTLGRLTRNTDPKGQATTYTHWYETGNTLTLKDAKNQTTTWTYNLRGQLLTKLYPNGDDHAYTYDTLGRMATHTTPKNETCTYTYDLRDRQTLADWNTTTPDTAKTYWANGLLKSIDNTVSKSDYAYSVKNQLTSETQTLAGQPAKTVSYQYDADGLRLQMNSPSGSPVDYEWTAKAQLGVISRDGPPPLATYTYDKAGRPDLLAHENGITEDFTYDTASQLQSRTHKQGGATVSGHSYTLDTTGRRTAETFPGTTTPARTYGYDTADQVTSATYGGGLADSYAYDAAANRSGATVAALGGTATTYAANSANQYTSIGGAVPRLPQHDPNGNLTNDGAGVTYTWDSENRLLSITDGTTTNTFTYDGNHRRVTKRTAFIGTVTNKVHYVYDGWNVIEERTNTDTTTYYNLTTFALTKTLTWGTDLSGTFQGAGGVGGLLMVEEIGSTTTAYHFQYDGNGNVTEITDNAGNPAATYRYDAFGNTLVAIGSYAATNRYRFSTKPLDSEIANAPLYYYGYRYYEPQTGRWPSRDPIGEKGGMNLYRFSANNGVDKWDYLGMIDTVYGLTGNPHDPARARAVAETTGKQAMLDSIKEYEELVKKWEDKPENNNKRIPITGPREWGGWVCEKCIKEDEPKEYSYHATIGKSVSWPQGAVGASGAYATISPVQHPKCTDGEMIVAMWHTHPPRWVPDNRGEPGYYSNSLGTNQNDLNVAAGLGLKYNYVVWYQRGREGEEPIIEIAK